MAAGGGAAGHNNAQRHGGECDLHENPQSRLKDQPIGSPAKGPYAGVVIASPSQRPKQKLWARPSGFGTFWLRSLCRNRVGTWPPNGAERGGKCANSIRLSCRGCCSRLFAVRLW